MYRENYNYWLESPIFDQATKDELKATVNEEDIKERFHKNLEFGTAGLRGVLGAGTNRMNIYTVRKASQGFANYLLKNGDYETGVAIAFDPRHMSKEFAKETALTFNANGIKAYVYKELRPTPQLSFTVRCLKCAAGVMITASHNPPEYNGYKVYGPDGAQVNHPYDQMIIDEVNSITDFGAIKTMTLEDAKAKGLYIELDEDLDKKFINQALGLSIKPKLIKEKSRLLNVIYSPLHGAGLMPVREVLKAAGFENFHILEEQAAPDGDFPTINYPNPEDPEAFKLGIAYAEKIDADLIVASDPDADRIGVVCKNLKGEYTHLSGNMVGVLLADYILSQKTLPDKPTIITSLVSTNMTKAITRHYNANYLEVFTGFKYVGDAIKKFSGGENFIYAFEESYGYLAGDYARDKDSVGVILLICEMALYYKSLGISLYQALENLYEKFGHYRDKTISITIKGITGAEKIRRIMAYFTDNYPKEFAGQRVTEFRNYNTSLCLDLTTGQEHELTMPKANVLYFVLSDGSWFCVRPSGTEPKVKFYIGVEASMGELADEKLNAIEKELMAIVNDID